MSATFSKKKWTKPFTKNTSKKEIWNKTGTYLIIVESPSKCKKIEEYLGNLYQCIASKGHLRQIESLKSIEKGPNYNIQFSNIPDKESHIEFMRKIIPQFPPENIILATDDDREGESIAWHICDLFGLSIATTKRIIFHEITKPALLKAVENPVILNMKFVQSQKARQVLDMIVGFKISPFLWKYIYSSKTNSLSAGRCQTASLRLIYDNYKERIDNNEPEFHYKTTAFFFTKNIPFVLNHHFLDKNKLLDFLNLSKNFNYKLNINSPKESIQNPPKPFNTSRLLQTASNVLHISPKQTMNYCQKLYQEGYITYMRTDSIKYSKDFLLKGKKFIEEKWGEKYVGSLDNLENKDNLNPHEAIRVTNLNCQLLSESIALEPHLQSIYKLIWKNTIESCMSEAKYKIYNASIIAPLNFTYLYEIEIPIFLGWKISKKLYDKVTEEQMDGTSIFLYLESILKTGSPFTYNKIENITQIKNKHSYYTEASLIKKLEELGIGRPSTFSLLVETIQERGYIKKKSIEGELLDCIDVILLNSCDSSEGLYCSKNSVIKEINIKKKWGNETNKLIIEPIGILAIEFLILYFNELFSYEYTQKMEKELDDILHNETPPFQICDHCYDIIGELTKKMNNIKKCKYTIEDYELVFQSFGPVLMKIGPNNIKEYKSIKKDFVIDLIKLQNNQYTLSELIEIKNDILGTYENKTVILKTGQYGAYVEWGEQTKSIKSLDISLNDITIEDIIPLLREPIEEEGDEEEKIRKLPTIANNMIREIDENISIRKGKFGPYIYYKTNQMNKPEFFPIKGLKQYNTLELDKLKIWIKEKYNIPRV